MNKMLKKKKKPLKSPEDLSLRLTLARNFLFSMEKEKLIQKELLTTLIEAELERTYEAILIRQKTRGYIC